MADFIFQRIEMKYLITLEQKEQLLKVIEPYMEIDQYGLSTIRNIYYDTDSYQLIRHSIEKPEYKEKLRVRSYSLAKEDSQVFIELKKKCESIVYKRRVAYPYYQAKDVLHYQTDFNSTQIDSEIQYFINFYRGIKPKMYISYQREAFYMKDGTDFRITFDQNILARRYNLDLKEEAYGTSLLDRNQILLEIKSSNSIPLWLVQFLSENRIYKTSFSKYGKAYIDLILKQEGNKYGAII